MPLNFPAAQAVQTLPLPLDIPGAQELQCQLPASLCFPTAQSMHSENPEPLYVPAGQDLQVSAPILYFPAGQYSHVGPLQMQTLSLLQRVVQASMFVLKYTVAWLCILEMISTELANSNPVPNPVTTQPRGMSTVST